MTSLKPRTRKNEHFIASTINYTFKLHAACQEYLVNVSGATHPTKEHQKIRSQVQTIMWDHYYYHRSLEEENVVGKTCFLDITGKGI